MSYSRIEYSVTDTYFDYLKPPLSKMITVSKDMCFDFIVIGATARDFLIRYVFHADMTALRATKDIDFAMLINDWVRYEEITQKMTADYGFVGTRYKQKFKHESIDIDIIPFGGISEKGYIFWPPDGSTRMSVKGFKEVYNSGIIINYDTIKFKFFFLIWHLHNQTNSLE
jgi:predicted nucleotidyltransferase